MNLNLMYVCKSLPWCWNSMCRSRNWHGMSQCCSSLHQAGSGAVCWDPKLGYNLDGNSIAEKGSQMWEQAKPSGEKMENSAPQDTTIATQLYFVGLMLPTGGFLPGCRDARSVLLSLWHPCYYCHVQTADTHCVKVKVWCCAAADSVLGVW